MWDEIAYPFLNFNGCTVEVYEYISNFIPHFMMDVIIYPCWSKCERTSVLEIFVCHKQYPIVYSTQSLFTRANQVKFTWHVRHLSQIMGYMMTSSNGNIFRVTGPLSVPVNFSHKGQWRGALMFSFICVWINSKQLWGWWFETPS